MTSFNISVDVEVSEATVTVIVAGITETFKVPVGTPPVVVVPPVVVPPAKAGSNVIYDGALGGIEQWPGDWSGAGVKENYNDTLNGETCLSITAVAAYPYWLPYAPNVSSIGTPSFDTTPYKDLVIKIKLNAASDAPTVGAYKYSIVNGVFTGDIMLNNGVPLLKYAGAVDAAGFVTCTVPLADLGAANLTELYKIIVQDAQCPVGSKWYVRYAAFV